MIRKKNYQIFFTRIYLIILSPNTILNYYHYNNEIQQNYLKVSQSYFYSLEINSNAIANNNNLITSEVQNKLAKYFIAIQSILETNAVLHPDKDSFKLIEVNINNKGGTCVGLTAQVEDQHSYYLLEKILNETVNKIINSILDKNLYANHDIAPLMATILLEDKTKDIAVPVKAKTKMKI